MNSADPHRPGLSEQLKYLDSAQGQLAPPPFDLDDIVRGGQRRHRRRTALNATGVAAAVIAVVAAVALGPLGRGGADGTPPDQIAGPPTATAGPSPSPSPIRAEAPEVSYGQSGETVTASLGATPVATLTLKAWSQSRKAVKVVLTATAQRPFTIEAMNFTLGVRTDNFDNEHSPVNLETLQVPVGSQEIVLDFETSKLPEVLIWALQPADDPDGGGIVGQWALTAENKV